MSVFYPHAEYAEDQPLAKTILITHVIYRGFQTGATIGIAAGALRAAFPTAKARATPLISNALTHASLSTPSVLQRPVHFQPGASRHTPSTSMVTQPTKTSVSRTAITTIGRSAGVGAVVGVAAMGLMMPFYMYGKETIEWQDRSWRLLANKGQVEVDSWSLAGAAVGIASLRTLPRGSISWKTVAGRAGVGSMIGVVGYMGWRYGIKKGKFE